ncbi:MULTISPECIES: hypothetical protein [unclassified Streptomyces]|uniref:hypothetical protein n=1 Tax=unclassified Streptomyces TaxID=2593676 RepID=UPI002885455C|nr:hypothetical protein [Streptomyces sp. DSM 41633]
MEFLLAAAWCLWLTTWLSVSVAAQFSDKVGDRLPRARALGLIPLWTFFAPQPGMHDMHLLYRDKLPGGSTGEIRSVPITEDRRIRHAVWNPKKFRNKVLWDAIDSLTAQQSSLSRDGRDLRAIMLSSAYLTLIGLAMQMPRPSNAVSRQFIVGRDKSFGVGADRAVIFVSEFHGFPSGKNAR